MFPASTYLEAGRAIFKEVQNEEYDCVAYDLYSVAHSFSWPLEGKQKVKANMR
jgi:hypothetical protein